MESEQDREELEEAGSDDALRDVLLELPYVPDFLLDDILFHFVPSRDKPRAVYHQLIGKSGSNWSSYYTKKGWNFLHGSGEAPASDGPYRLDVDSARIDLLPPGRFLAPRPLLHLGRDGPGIPIVSLEKRRPLNPWKPNYIRAVEFIKRFEWPCPVPRRVQAAFWEIEECGEIAGSTSWRNAEAILLNSDSCEVRETLEAVFYNRPEDFPLGSEVYLRVLGRMGRAGFQQLTALANHPVTRKRRAVARTLGELRDEQGVPTLLLLLDDEDPDVRGAALRSLAKVGVTDLQDPEGKVRAYLESPEPPYRVWASAALLAGGDESQRKYLIQLVKEEDRPLADLGDLGDVLVDLDLEDVVPFLIHRLKDERREISLDAAETLQRLTGEDVEFSAEQDAEQRRVAIKTYTRWWEERKRERSAQRRGRRKK
ncbi:MAG: HEAT repeat domain-containing protein [Planctomycetes bacterium]|nr:HEAT repeat domain-containing protein [Planctomycetota bacterium]